MLLLGSTKIRPLAPRLCARQLQLVATMFTSSSASWSSCSSRWECASFTPNVLACFVSLSLGLCFCASERNDGRAHHVCLLGTWPLKPSYGVKLAPKLRSLPPLAAILASLLVSAVAASAWDGEAARLIGDTHQNALAFLPAHPDATFQITRRRDLVNRSARAPRFTLFLRRRRLLGHPLIHGSHG